MPTYGLSVDFTFDAADDPDARQRAARWLEKHLVTSGPGVKVKLHQRHPNQPPRPVQIRTVPEVT